MLYTTQGINQKRFVEEGYAKDLDFNHATMLSWIYQWAAHPNSEKLMEGKKLFTWISHSLIVMQLPLIFGNLDNEDKKKRKCARIMKKFTDLGLLELHKGAKRLSRSYYCITPKLAGLMMEGAKAPLQSNVDPLQKSVDPITKKLYSPLQKSVEDNSNKDNSNKENALKAREGESLVAESKYVSDKMQQDDKEVKMLDMPLLVQNKSKKMLPEMLFLIAYYESVLATKGIAMSFTDKDVKESKNLLWGLKGTTDASYKEYLKHCKQKGIINPMSQLEYRKVAATKLGEGVGKHEFWGRQEVRSLAKNPNKVYADYKEAANALKAAKNTSYRKTRN